MPSIVSPLTGRDNVRKVRDLDIELVKWRYRSDYGMDVSRLFAGISSLAIYQCVDSGLRFYFPFSVIGDGPFYYDLSQAYPGYYRNWRWENALTLDLIKPADKVLEIGSGYGDFLVPVAKKGAAPTGLELNPDTVEQGKKRGVRILNEPIEIHARKYPEQYDVIAAFQLFEHVNDVGPFLSNTLALLKKGGKLAISVPNNDSLLFAKDPYHTLNLPPHHMLLWDDHSLNYMANYFNLSVVLHRMPVDRTTRGQLYNVWLTSTLGNRALAGIVASASRFLVKSTSVFSDQGATTLAIYTKN